MKNHAFEQIVQIDANFFVDYAGCTTARFYVTIVT